MSNAVGGGGKLVDDARVERYVVCGEPATVQKTQVPPVHDFVTQQNGQKFL